MVYLFMIQRTMFNKLTIDRIEEVFSPKWAGQLDSYIAEWREALAAGQVQGCSFYISINDQMEMDGILLQDTVQQSGTIFAGSSEAAQNLIERARTTGVMKTLNGDSESCKWAL